MKSWLNYSAEFRLVHTAPPRASIFIISLIIVSLYAGPDTATSKASAAIGASNVQILHIAYFDQFAFGKHITQVRGYDRPLEPQSAPLLLNCFPFGNSCRALRIWGFIKVHSLLYSFEPISSAPKQSNESLQSLRRVLAHRGGFC